MQYNHTYVYKYIYLYLTHIYCKPTSFLQVEDGDVWSNQTVADVGKVLKLLSQQESTVEDDEKFREAEQAYVLLGTLAVEMVLSCQVCSRRVTGNQEADPFVYQRYPLYPQMP